MIKTTIKRLCNNENNNSSDNSQYKSLKSKLIYTWSPWSKNKDLFKTKNNFSFLNFGIPSAP